MIQSIRIGFKNQYLAYQEDDKIGCNVNIYCSLHLKDMLQLPNKNIWYDKKEFIHQ